MPSERIRTHRERTRKTIDVLKRRFGVSPGGESSSVETDEEKRSRALGATLERARQKTLSLTARDSSDDHRDGFFHRFGLGLVGTLTRDRHGDPSDTEHDHSRAGFKYVARIMIPLLLAGVAVPSTLAATSGNATPAKRASPAAPAPATTAPATTSTTVPGSTTTTTTATSVPSASSTSTTISPATTTIPFAVGTTPTTRAPGTTTTTTTTTTLPSPPLVVDILGPNPVYIDRGQTHVFRSSISGGTGYNSEQWLIEKPGQNNFQAIPGAIGAQYTFTADANTTLGTYHLELKDTDSNGTKNMAEVEFIVSTRLT